MTNWRFTYDVNKYVRDGDENDFKAIAQKIVNDLQGQRGFRNEAAKQLLQNLNAVQSLGEFNDAWGSLYDYADREAIWLGV